MLIPISRVLDRLDEYLNKKQFDEAEKHLFYWLNEADNLHDTRGALTVINEQIGLYRKLNKKAECFKVIEKALKFTDNKEFLGTVMLGTTFINIATGYKAFGMSDKALPLYKKAEKIYENTLEKNDSRFGGLFNNMALAYMDENDFINSKKYFDMALSVMRNISGGELESAITYCNLADLEYLKNNEKVNGKVVDYLSTAKKCFDNENLIHDGYYAFVCEKCAFTFDFYEQGDYAKELNERAEKIYERT